MNTRQRAARIVASLGGIGYAPIASGTWGSAAAVLLALPLLAQGGIVLAEATLAATIIGVVATEWTGAADRDPGFVVIDELAGQWMTMLALPTHPSMVGLGAAFILFRLLDILKPGPIGWIDRRHNAAGVMGDDLLAGAVAAAILWGVGRLWPHGLG